jgi:hypothetical protein
MAILDSGFRVDQRFFALRVENVRVCSKSATPLVLGDVL